MRPVVLDAAEGVRGWLHLPEGGVAPSGVGVLLVPPLGWDEQASYRPRRVWADRLAAAGHAVLRIDLPGTGDSGGGPRDADRVPAWLAAIAAAAAFLRVDVGAARVAAVGLGAGGLLVLHATRFDSVVLWGCPPHGRGAVRELRAFARLEVAQTGEDPATWPAGELHVGGVLLTAATAAALTALDPPVPGDRAPARALLLGRDGVGPDAGLHAALEAAGAAVADDPGSGWGTFTAPPQEADLFAAVEARVTDFLAVDVPDLAFTAPARDDVLRGAGYSESALAVEVDGTTVVGILTEPDGPAGDVAALLLNAGALRHIGPNRMWVEAARRCAAGGVRVLRLDLEGIGDADGAPAPYADDLDLYTPELTRQVRAAVDVLAERHGARRFLLAGLCAGGYWSLHTALADPRVRTVVLFNPRLLFWERDAPVRYELFRALSVLRRGGLARLRGATAPWRRLGSLVAALPRLLWSLPSRGETADALTEALRTLRAQGQRLDLAFSAGDEPLRDELERTGRWPELDAAGVRRHPLPLIGHTLKGLEAQRAAHAVLDEAVTATFETPAVAAHA